MTLRVRHLIVSHDPAAPGSASDSSVAPTKVVLSVDEFYYGTAGDDQPLRRKYPQVTEAGAFNCSICERAISDNLRCASPASLRHFFTTFKESRSVDVRKMFVQVGPAHASALAADKRRRRPEDVCLLLPPVFERRSTSWPSRGGSRPLPLLL